MSDCLNITKGLCVIDSLAEEYTFINQVRVQFEQNIRYEIIKGRIELPSKKGKTQEMSQSNMKKS